ncbi:MAG: YeeE/YedE family protein [Rhodospirillales bacterium]|nr:YeeE/YedE family protein [Rhodospirillales bacterium]
MNALVQALRLRSASGGFLSDARTVTIAGGGLLAGAVLLAQGVSGQMAALLLIGGALGLVLYHAAFGFTSAWRVFIADRQGAGLRAQMLMLAVATLLFLPVLATGSLFGQPVVGAVAPVGVSLLVGAFMFGAGMQMGGGCASGTLFTAGGGNTRMWITLAAFIAGSVIATAHVPWWFAQPALPSISLLGTFGLEGALVLQLAIFAGIAGLTVVLERRRHGRLIAEGQTDRRGLARLISGPWPLVWGALGLAGLNFLTLGVAGHPWGITYGLTLWGAKIASGLGVDVAAWEFWTWPFHKNALAGSVFANTTSVMNFGIIAGALLAAGLAGRFAPSAPWRLPLRSILAAIIGGLLMGYGARLAFGCNIGAYFSGIASASLHGWVWFVAAMAGSVLGTRLRPLFGLAVERARPSGC